MLANFHTEAYFFPTATASVSLGYRDKDSPHFFSGVAMPSKLLIGFLSLRQGLVFLADQVTEQLFIHVLARSPFVANLANVLKTVFMRDIASRDSANRDAVPPSTF